jgi:hypothetical protein
VAAPARKAREKKVRAAVDGRALRAKGRSAQCNIKMRPDLKAALDAWCEAQGLALADWAENAVLSTLGRED